MDTINDLPDEILEKVFSNLSPYREYDVVSCVCKRWKRVIAVVSLQFQKEFEMSFENKNISWTEVTIKSHEHESGTAFMSPRLLHCACYNDEARSMYVFGGRSVGSQSAGFNDLWKLDLYSKKWIRPLISGDFPPPKYGSSIESCENNLILYGGRSLPCNNSLGLYRQKYFNNELHVFDIRTDKWTLKSCLQTEMPPGLYAHRTCIVFDQSGIDKGCMVLFGGIKEQNGTNSNEVWCLSLSSYVWWKPSIVGSLPDARHSHTQVALKSRYTYSSAVIVAGGCTTDNQILTDVWLLIRSGHCEWTSSRLTVLPGPHGFVPPISVLKRSAVKVGQNLIFFGTCPHNKIPTKRATLNRIYPYENSEFTSKPTTKYGNLNVHWNNLKYHQNPVCAYVLDISRAISAGVATWRSPYGCDQEPTVICSRLLGPNKPNYFIAVVARGEIIFHGDFPLTNPQTIERSNAHSQEFLRSMGKNKWTPLYIVSRNSSKAF